MLFFLSHTNPDSLWTTRTNPVHYGQLQIWLAASEAFLFWFLLADAVSAVNGRQSTLTPSAAVWRLLSLCFTVAGHSPRSHSVQPQTLEFFHQVQTEQVVSSCVCRQESLFAAVFGAWRSCCVAAVRLVVGMRSCWDAAFLQQPQESQWWRGDMCRGGGGDGLDVRTNVLVVGWWGSTQELTVPTRWQAVRAKPVKRKKKRCINAEITTKDNSLRQMLGCKWRLHLFCKLGERWRLCGSGSKMAYAALLKGQETVGL